MVRRLLDERRVGLMNFGIGLARRGIDVIETPVSGNEPAADIVSVLGFGHYFSYGF